MTRFDLQSHPVDIVDHQHIDPDPIWRPFHVHRVNNRPPNPNWFRGSNRRLKTAGFHGQHLSPVFSRRPVASDGGAEPAFAARATRSGTNRHHRRLLPVPHFPDAPGNRYAVASVDFVLNKIQVQIPRRQLRGKTPLLRASRCRDRDFAPNARLPQTGPDVAK
jgi:hypothetical protein